jgi:RNA ligase
MSNAPYRHSDGSDCYTKNCSRGHANAVDIAILENNFDAYLAAKSEENFSKTFIDVIASRKEFDRMVEDKLIFRQEHPEYPYSIYKYSQSATYSKTWNEVTLSSRGLIIHNETGEIIARPFDKFFNYNEDNVPKHLLVGDIHVTEKLDGSLGISFINPKGELEISTAGGFKSEQAIHATKIYNERYKGKWEPKEGRTYMWEIIYPENRIVVDYGDEDDIYLLGARDIATGKTVPVDEVHEWKWKRAETHKGFESMDKVVNSSERSNAEGYIVHYVQTDVRVKYKHEEYVKVHRIATGLSERSIYDLLSTGGKQKLEDYKSQAPEEFETYINEVTFKLEKQFHDEKNKIETIYNNLVSSLPSDIDQKSFALAVQTKVSKNLSSHMFSLHDGRGVNEKKIWDSIKPVYERSFWSSSNGIEK